MDTLILQPKNIRKVIVSILSFSIITGLVFSFLFIKGLPLLASESIKLANTAIVSPILQSSKLDSSIKQKLTEEEKIEKFNKQIKEKYKNGVILDIDKGVKRIKITKYIKGRPIKMNVVEINFDINPNLKLEPVLASQNLNSKSKISSMAQKNNSIVAINGTFFKPETGVPLGTLMIDKTLYTGPVYNRVAMGIFDNHYDMARVQLNASLISSDKSIKIDNINQPRMLSTYMIVYTPKWGEQAPQSPKYGQQIAVSNNKIIEISKNRLNIPKDGFVVVGPEKQLNRFKINEEVKLNLLTMPGWENVNHIISGGPYLVKRGEVYIDMTDQKLMSIGGRNPRTAIGYTAENNFIIVTVDGREESSIGMTLMELAKYMKSIGCHNAMNLDGGGSTVLYVKGEVVNHPQVKGGIALSNALALNKS